MISVFDVFKKYIEFKKENNLSESEISNLEPETIRYALDLPDNTMYNNAVGAINSIINLKKLDDYVAFEKITMALNYKTVDTSVEQDPNLPEVMFAYFFVKKIIATGDEVRKWIAAKFIRENLFICPEGFEFVQDEINKYLNSNFKDLLNKVSKIKKSKIEDWPEGSMERLQLEKLKECEKYIEENAGGVT